MKIGDKVRFVSEVGGGRISAFQPHGVVLVEDEDGFEIPVLAHEVVVIDEEKERPFKPQAEPAKTSPYAAEDAPEVEPCDRPITFQARPLEKAGGNRVSLQLCFVPVGGVEGLFRAFLVNDSNYYLQTLLLQGENASWTARFMATLEPNSKQLVDELTLEDLPQWERLSIQALAYKTDKPFQLKPAFSREVRVDVVKFYKQHTTFQPTPFFSEPALAVDVVREDKGL